MSDQTDDSGKIYVDDDWKAEAKKEKEKLAVQESKAQGPLPDPSFTEIVNMIAMQAVVGLGGMRLPDGRTMPPDLNIAKHHIDMLEVLENKAKGNMTEDEEKLLATTLYELRLQYVQAGTPPPHA